MKGLAMKTIAAAVAAMMLCSLIASPALYGEDIVTEPIRTFSGHSDCVRSVAFSPDGTKVLTGGGQTARLWDAATGAWILTFSGQYATVLSVAFSPDGTKVLAGSSDGTARLWNVATGAPIRTFIGHTSHVSSVAFSPDGAKVLTGSWDYTARLWDAATGAQIRTFSGHTNYVWSVAFSPDGTKVLAGSYDKTARLWDAATGAHIHTFTGHTIGVKSVAYSPDGTKVLTGSMDDTARLWDAATGALIRTFSGHTSDVYSVAFSPDGTRVFTGSADGTARLWNVDTGAPIRTFIGHTDQVWSVAYSPAGTKVLTGSWDYTAKLWDAGPQLVVRSSPITGVFIAGDAPGLTEYNTYTQASQRVTLTAPPITLSGAVRYDFIRWEIDGQQQPTGQVSVQLAVDRSMTATAVYEIRKQTLAISSRPIAGLSVTGTRPGSTGYAVTCNDQEAVALGLASAAIWSGGNLYSFIYWLIDGQAQPRGQTTIEIVMNADHTADALYNLFGDANGDCTVNILDLLFVRNRLGLDPATDENWRADVNQDGSIDILDLIRVRNELGARCGE